MCDPRDPLCDHCDHPALSGYNKCVACQVRYHADNQQVFEACEVGQAAGMTRDEINQILRESADYAAWAAEQNSKPRCKRCKTLLTEDNKSHWVGTGCCIVCEDAAMRFARSA